MVSYGFAKPLGNREIPIIFSTGAASGDYDNDGDIDIFIVRGDMAANLLYRNRGDMTFEDVAAAAGVAFTKSATESYLHGTPAFADLDGDDDLDLLLTGLNNDPAIIYANNGDGTFTDVSAGSGLDTIAAQYSHSPALGDYDLDGDLDLMLGHWGTPRDFMSGPGDTEHLWRNDTDAAGIKFTNVSIAVGIAPSIIANADPLVSQQSFDNTFTPTFARIDDDMYADILSVGDFNSSQVFINNGDGTFRNDTDYSVIIDGNGMGSAVGDYDGDGDLDWFVSSILADDSAPANLSKIGNRLYRNDAGVFVDTTIEAGVDNGGWGWGSCFIDFDNDGNLGIYHTNGWPDFDEFGGFPTDQSRAFISNGDGTFTEDAGGLGVNDAEEGRGIVCADFDGDGDVDILQMHRNSTNAATIWRNETDGDSNYLTVKLRGVAPNTEAVGAHISIVVGGDAQSRDVVLGSNFASHNPTEQYFGLGANARVDSLTVRWPDGKETMLSSVAANQKLEIPHPDR